MGERWAAIPDWPFCEVSDHGRIRTSYSKNGQPRRSLIRKLRVSRNGYHTVLLSEGPKNRTRAKMFYVHRLVAAAFVDGDRSLFVCHLDGDRLNNHFSNLKWATQKENMQHAREHGTLAVGERAGGVTLCDAGVRAALRMHECGFPIIDIGYFFDVDPVTVWGWVNGVSRATAIKKAAI